MSVYDYLLTKLDDMPDGWQIAFGEQMCHEIADELEEHGDVEKYRVMQIKEKFGVLRWYDRGSTEKIRTEIIPKYRKLSACTCIKCGAPAEWESVWWLSPWCSKCKDEVPKDTERFVPIEEYFNEIYGEE